MAETNADSKIQLLIQKVKEKKEKITKAEKPHWITNCSFGYTTSKDASTQINVQVINDIEEFVRALAFLIERENSYNAAATALGVKSTFSWRGYSLEDWKADFQTRISKLQIAKEKAELELLERRLDSIISPEMRREMELADIESLLA